MTASRFGGGQQGFVNPEYYDRFGAYGYEPHKTVAIDSNDDPATKKRKLMNMTVCVDHLRGYCERGARCSKIHADHVPSLDEREIMAKTKFCHDFQNRGICSRETCRFLHVTRREEDEFLLTGTIPQSVFDRARERADSQDPNYSSFSGERPPHRGPRPGSFGGGGRSSYPPLRPPPQNDYYSQQYEYDSNYHYPQPPPLQPWGEGLSHPHRGRKSSEGGAGGHSYSQPVTYGNYCIDYLKGTCMKGTSCRLMHVQVVEDMDDREAIVKNVFCHDFQNKRCPRVYCKYIHANFDEQKIFVEQGYFPGSLCERNKSKVFFCDICIDNLRSQCTRGSGCQHRHVNCVEDKQERICLSRSIFCHDYQESGCPRTTCKLIHTNKGDESYFLQTGCLPEHLRNRLSDGDFDPSIETIAETVCRDFMKGVCNRASCKFYHPSYDEKVRLNAYQKAKRASSSGGGGPPNISGGGGGAASADTKSTIDEVEYNKLKQTNEELKQRVQQLERLLADACHCITLAVGDQNPAIQTLMQTIASLAPESSLAKSTSVNDASKKEPNSQN